jgi:nitric oxide synthase-interacting protein
MARKSKQAGSGHLPLTNYERKLYSKEHGTQTQRLSGTSQHTFGHCALGLVPAEEEPVATHSGYIYERAAILEYLLTKTQELKQQQADYDRQVAQEQTTHQQEQDTRKRAAVEKFQDSQKVVVAKKQKTDTVNPLKQTSYWLSEFQPQTSQVTTLVAPPKRPPSPNSQQPLRLKDLIPLDLKRNEDNQVICAISQKSITAQPALALIPKAGPAQVVLQQVYQDLGNDKVCPITGAKIKWILQLQTGGSSFASAGKVEASTYRPTMT